jgi:hypothetical protein
MLKKKIKKERKGISEHRTYANPPPKTPPAKPQQAAGMRKYKRSLQPKKSPRSSIKRKEII